MALTVAPDPFAYLPFALSAYANAHFSAGAWQVSFEDGVPYSEMVDECNATATALAVALRPYVRQA